MSVPPVPNTRDITHTLIARNGKLQWSPPDIVSGVKKVMLIIAGQSNAQGSSLSGMTEHEKTPNPKIFSYSRGITYTYLGQTVTTYTVKPKGTIIPAVDPLQHHGITSDQSIGFWRTFCEEYLKDNPNTEITIMPCALGGTGFTPSKGNVITWDRTIKNATKNLYNEMITDCNEVLTKNPDMDVLGLLWHQGENDVYNTQYAHKLDTLVRDVRVDLYNNKGWKMPFICGTMLAYWKNLVPATSQVDLAHKSIRWRFNDGRTDCSWFDWMTDPPAEDGLNVHFNADALRKMGRSYYVTYKKMFETIQQSRSLDMSFEDDNNVLTYDEKCVELYENEGKNM